MTDEQIVKALEITSEDIICAVADENNKTHFVTNQNVLALIERQRTEIRNLEYTLLGVMHSVDKWLDGDELEQDEVNRAITMREKTLSIVESLQDENAKAKAEAIREVFEKIDAILRRYYEARSDSSELKLLEPIRQAERFIINEMWHEITSLKKEIAEEQK